MLKSNQKFIYHPSPSVRPNLNQGLISGKNGRYMTVVLQNSGYHHLLTTLLPESEQKHMYTRSDFLLKLEDARVFPWMHRGVFQMSPGTVNDLLVSSPFLVLEASIFTTYTRKLTALSMRSTLWVFVTIPLP